MHVDVHVTQSYWNWDQDVNVWIVKRFKRILRKFKRSTELENLKIDIENRKQVHRLYKKSKWVN